MYVFFNKLLNIIIGYKMKFLDDMLKFCYSLMLKCWEENLIKWGNFGEIVKKL